jgi:hypothetical protein
MHLGYATDPNRVAFESSTSENILCRKRIPDSGSRNSILGYGAVNADKQARIRLFAVQLISLSTVCTVHAGLKRGLVALYVDIYALREQLSMA